MGYIQNIGTALPASSLTQDEFVEIYSGLTNDSDTRRKLSFLAKKSAIDKRHCITPDIASLLSMSLQEKMSLFHQEAVRLAKKSILANPAWKDPASFTDIITVSCTGMQAPGIEIDLIQELGLSTEIKRYNINFMGCYASLTALRLANEICQRPGRRVLIVSVELCTLHFQDQFIDDYLLSNSLFADGSASVIVCSENQDARLSISDFESRLVPNSKDEMSWKLSPDGFLMTLSAKVPSSIKDSLHDKALFSKDPREITWAVHPGGKQIIDGIASVLSLDDESVAVSRAVLRQFGNMSSSTILFVLKELLKVEKRKPIIACAFGPGLTLESALIDYV